MTELPEPLKPFEAWPQWVVWRIEQRDGKDIKRPYNARTGYPAKVTDPSTFAYASTALEAVAKWGDEWNVGFVFTANDPFFFLDIDKCKDEAGAWSPLALELLGRLPGAAIEVSQSGTGLHVFGTYTQGFAHGCKNVPLGLELYTEGRFCRLNR